MIFKLIQGYSRSKVDKKVRILIFKRKGLHRDQSPA